IARSCEILAEAFIREEPETLIAPIITRRAKNFLRQPDRPPRRAAKEVLFQGCYGCARCIIEEGVGVQGVSPGLVEEAAVIVISARFGDHFDLGHAASGI